MLGKILVFGVAAVALASGLPKSSVALPFAPPNTAQIDDVSNVIEIAKKGGGKGGGGQAKPRANKAKAATHKRTTVKRNVTVRRNVVNRNVVHRTVVVRPYRAWVHRPYYGVLIGGVALGTIIVATTPRVVPVAPAPNLCWFWSDPEQINGYWDYCT